MRRTAMQKSVVETPASQSISTSSSTTFVGGCVDSVPSISNLTPADFCFLLVCEDGGGGWTYFLDYYYKVRFKKVCLTLL